MNFDYRKNHWYKDIVDTSSDDLIQNIFKNAKINNVWRRLAFREIEYRFRLGLSDNVDDTKNNLDIIKKELPECFL